MTKKNLLQSVEQVCFYYQTLRGEISIEDIGAMARDMLESSVHILDKSGSLIGFTVNQNDTCRLTDAQSAQRVAKMLAKDGLQITVAKDGVCPYNEGNCAFEKRTHIALPLVYASKRIGTLVCTRDGEDCDECYLAVCKLLGMLCSMALYNKMQENENTLKLKSDTAQQVLQSLSYSERSALQAIISALPRAEAPAITQGFINASTISKQSGITRSVIASALKKLEGAGIIRIRSLGMKGTHLTVLNPFIYELDFIH